MTVVMEATTAAWLVAAALSDLLDRDLQGGCCPTCCAPCGALKQLLDASQLDDIVRRYYRDDDRYIWIDGQVDRNFLKVAWRRTDCHEAQGEGGRRAGRGDRLATGDDLAAGRGVPDQTPNGASGTPRRPA